MNEFVLFSCLGGSWKTEIDAIATVIINITTRQGNFPVLLSEAPIPT